MSAEARDQSSTPRIVLVKVLKLNLCPKGCTANIPEYIELRECLRRGTELGWPHAVWLQTWVVLQGIRGEEGVRVAAAIIGIGVPSWHVDAYWDAFINQWLSQYREAARRTGRLAVCGHEEGLAVGMTGHHYVEALRCPLQRQRVRRLAHQLEQFAAEDFGPKQILEVKRFINESGLQLREATSTAPGAGLASSTGYNAMNWTRVLSLLFRELLGARKVFFTKKLWTTMLQCQGGHDVLEALDFFGVPNARSANEVLRLCPDVGWEVLFVAICESRQAWQHFKDNGECFCRIVAAVDAHEGKHTKTIRRFTKLLVQRESKGRACFSTNLFLALLRKFHW